ncbi:MAG TPA: hypothetical protein VH041_11045 [Caldimonas sp.]|nr:hypothetical protein [Caldimonas sp.]HEX4234834.1 hypothetical protein [Caldimonas sp.]
MAERRRVSLLECAVAASAAIVPVLLGVFALVAVVRPGEPDSIDRQGRSDRYVSVRRVAALKIFERAIVERRSDAPLHTDALAVLAGVPACRREWGGGTPAARWLRELAGARVEATAAEQIAVQMNEIDAALLRFSSRVKARVEHRVGLDSERWFAAAADALATPVEAVDAPGRRFQVRCADLADALESLRRGDAAMLETLAWRGTEGSATLARWRADQQMQITAQEVTRKNPWGGVPGCIYLGSGGDAAPAVFLAPAHSAQQRVCAMAAVRGVATAASGSAAAPHAIAVTGEPGVADRVDDPRWQVPPSILTLLQPLESLRQPAGALYRAYAGDDDELPRVRAGRIGSRNHVNVDGAPVDVGYSIDLTIDPALQALAQKTAACYTGRHEVCRALGMRRAEDGDRPLGSQLLEGAMVRMAAVVVIDIASGRIEALAGTLSPCARQEVDGPGRDPNCDTRLPYQVHYRADALLNPAIYHSAMPASTIKPIMATAFLADGERGSRLLAAERAAMQRGGDAIPAHDSLRGQLMRSDSARFLDRMFCFEQGFAACHRPWDVQAAAAAYGWNAGCDDPRDACGSADLLFGRPLERSDARDWNVPGPTAIAYGRLLSEPVGNKLGSPMHLMPPMSLDPGIVRRCAFGADGRRGSDDDWEKCKGGAVVDVVAEGWGQGHARASVLGVAGMMATLASAANGSARVPRPHLVDAIHGVAGTSADAFAAAAARWSVPATAPPPLSREAAEVILSGLSFSHRAGTARTACEQVFDARRCRDIAWLAGKTGTPSFPSDGLTLDTIVRLCRTGAPPSPEAQRGACSSLRPYKWYVAAFRADRAKDGPWTKAIAVLAERNWLRASGRIHGTGDHGPNPAAEIAMQIVGRTTGEIEGIAP